MIGRRSFLIGLAVTGAATQIATKVVWGDPVAAIQEPSKLWLAKGFDWAALQEVYVSSMRDADTELHKNDPVVYTFRRDGRDLMCWQMHHLAMMRWCAMPDSEIIINLGQPIRLDIEPCHTHTVVNLTYNIERDREKPKIVFNEVFRCKGNQIISHELMALNPANQHLLEQGA